MAPGDISPDIAAHSFGAFVFSQDKQPENTMELQITTTQDDWMRFQKFTISHIRKKTKGLINTRISFFILFFVAIVSSFLVNVFQIDIHINRNVLIFVTFIIVFAILYYNNIKSLKAIRPSDNGPMTGQHTLQFDSTGIHESAKLYEIHYRWAAVKEIVHATGLILIYIDTVFAILIPDDQVGDVDTFIKTIEAYRNNSPS